MSRFGATRGEPDYDRFRTGLTYRQVRTMMSDRRWRRRRGVLGFWNQLKREMYLHVTGVALVVLLVAGCGSVSALAVDAAPEGALDSGAGEAPPDPPEVSSPDLPPAGTDADASPALPPCAFDAHAPHEVVACPGGSGWSCHYLDSGGRPDGFLTGCQDGGRECVYPCQ